MIGVIEPILFTCSSYHIKSTFMSSPSDYFAQVEAKNAYRLTWTTIGADKVDALKLAIPNSILYSPIKPLEEQQVSNEEPVMCQKCKALISNKKFQFSSNQNLDSFSLYISISS